MLSRKILVIAILLSIAKVNAQTRKTVEILESRYQNCLDKGVNMLVCSEKYYFQMDSMLNVVYKKLKKQMSTTQFSILKREQIQWLRNRDKYFNTLTLDPEEKELSKEDQDMVLIDKKAQFIESRVLVLIDKMNSNTENWK